MSDNFSDKLVPAIYGARLGAQPGSSTNPELTNTDYAAGVWYPSTNMGGWTPNLAAASALVNGTITLVPFVPRFTHTFTGIGWWHSSAAQNGQNIRLGIYGSTGGIPSGAALVDSGTIATTASAALRSATISQKLVAGQLYWLAGNADASLTGAQWVAPTTINQPAWSMYGIIDPATAFTAKTTGLFVGLTQTAVFGALPSIGTLVDNALAAANPAIIMLKG